MDEHEFTTYVRTKTVFQYRLKDLNDYSCVKICIYELRKLGVNNGKILHRLRQLGEIAYSDDGKFRALRDGPIKPELLNKTKKWDKIPCPLTALHLYMRDQLKYVTIDPIVPYDRLPPYFKAFLEHRHSQLDMFFSVDGFSQRVHTPVVNLKENLRSALRLHGEPLCSLDVKQMQPTILAKVLHDAIGRNPFSDAIFKGTDVYVLLLEKNKYLPDRKAAKIFLYQLIFGKPVPEDDIAEIFEGDTNWIRWINRYKSRNEPKNPHGRETHTNLAWLLQYSEVQVMSGIWRRLMDLSIPFLTIHDDVLCQRCKRDKVSEVMKDELSKHFDYFELSVTDHKICEKFSSDGSTEA